LVELRGLEPLTPCMPCRCATSCATAPSCSLRNLCVFPKQPDQRSPETAKMRIGGMWLPSRCPGHPKPARRHFKAKKNPPESFDSGGSSGGAEGTRTPDPLHAMQVRYQLRHSPIFLLLQASRHARGIRTSVRISPKQLKYLRTAFPKIPNRAYSVARATPARRQQRPWPKRRLQAAGPPPGSPSRDVPGHRRHGLPHAERG
jgi:hypothetical protein